MWVRHKISPEKGLLSSVDTQCDCFWGDRRTEYDPHLILGLGPMGLASWTSKVRKEGSRNAWLVPYRSGTHSAWAIQLGFLSGCVLPKVLLFVLPRSLWRQAGISWGFGGCCFLATYQGYLGQSPDRRVKTRHWTLFFKPWNSQTGIQILEHLDMNF